MTKIESLFHYVELTYLGDKNKVSRYQNQREREQGPIFLKYGNLVTENREDNRGPHPNSCLILFKVDGLSSKKSVEGIQCADLRASRCLTSASDVRVMTYV